MRRFLATLPVLSLVVVLAACGSSDDDDTSGTAGATVPSVSETTPPGSGPPTSGPPTSGPPTSTQGTTPATPTVTAQPLPPSSVPVSVPSGGTPIEHDLPLVAAAADDLARRLDVDPGAVTVVEALAVTWPDSSYGCPEPGMMYTQVLTDGTFVLLESAGRQYQYHGGDPLFLCEPGQGPLAPES